MVPYGLYGLNDLDCAPEHNASRSRQRKGALNTA